jgi:outer membrane receptor for ferrienterochelin and colicin
VTRDIGGLRLIAGLRGDGHIQNGDIFVGALDPRLSFRYNLSEDTSINGGIGVFSQFPQTDQLETDAGGNPDLLVERSFQYAIGGIHRFTQSLRWESTVFYSDLNQLIRGSGTGIQFGGGPPREGEEEDAYRNTGTGRVYGLESLLRYDNTNIIALFSATLSRSERTNENGNTRLFTFDQPYLFNALFSWLMPKNKRIGARVRYGAGNPYTPVVNSIYDLDTRTFSAVNGEQDSGRVDPFFSLDIRYDKTYVFDLWKLTTYIDIQNITNYPNIELMSYNFDYSEERPITGLPIFPALGIQGEW